MHLNPVRIGGLGLGNEARRRGRGTGGDDPGAELVRRRLRVLAEYRWSWSRVDAGLERAPGWLSRGRLQGGAGDGGVRPSGRRWQPRRRRRFGRDGWRIRGKVWSGAWCLGRRRGFWGGGGRR